MSVEARPIRSLRWLDFLWLPSKRQTKKARRILIKELECYFPSIAVQAFIDGSMVVGTVVQIDGRTLALRGVYPKMELPQAMVFWDSTKKCHVQFTRWEPLRDFQIIN